MVLREEGFDLVLSPVCDRHSKVSSAIFRGSGGGDDNIHTLRRVNNRDSRTGRNQINQGSSTTTSTFIHSYETRPLFLLSEVVYRGICGEE